MFKLASQIFADYVKLKMMTYTIHKDFAKDVLARFKKP